MSKVKFTGGEWEVADGTKIGEQVLFVRVPTLSNKGKVICRLTRVVDIHIPLSEQDIANAHLIAAAPTMYKEIQEEIEWLERLAKKYVIGSYELQGIQLRIQRKKELLAKARGE